MKPNKNLRENCKESQLPSKTKGCNEITRFQGQLRFPGKLGMCPSLAEPDSGGIPRRTSLRENGLQRPAKKGSLLLLPAACFIAANIKPVFSINSPHKNEKSPPKRKTVRGKPTVFLMEEIIQCNGADYEARTRYLHLGKVALYQMS